MNINTKAKRGIETAASAPSFKLLRDAFEIGLRGHVISTKPFQTKATKQDYQLSVLKGSLTANNLFHTVGAKIADKLGYASYGAVNVQTFAMSDDNWHVYVTYDNLGGSLRFEIEEVLTAKTSKHNPYMALAGKELADAEDEVEPRVFGAISDIKSNRVYNWVGTPLRLVKKQMANLRKRMHPSLRYGRDWEYAGSIGDAGDIYITKDDKTFLGANGLPLFLAYLNLDDQK